MSTSPPLLACARHAALPARRPRTRWARLGATLALAAASAVVHADPGYYVVTIYDDPGRRTVDFRYWTTSLQDKPTVVWPELGLGWNVDGRWYTELLASWIGSQTQATRLSTLNWQNDYLLTQGQWPLDVGVHTQLIRSAEAGEGTVLEFGPLLQTDIDRTQLNFNLIFDRQFGGDRARPTRLKTQWQLRHRLMPALHLGLQGFGELGPWDHWSARAKQSHRAGPALFGKLPWGEQRLEWQAAWLGGSVYGRHGHMLTARVQLVY